MPMNNTTGISVTDLVERTRKFIRFELVHAGVSVAIFFGILLALQPWNYNSGSSQTRGLWMVGIPLVFFMVDLLLAMMLHFGMQNELRPRTCNRWIFLQVGNLILLTFLGVFMIWQFEFVDYTYLNLIGALLVLYLYKAYKISIMRRLVGDMNAFCSTFQGINNGSNGNIIYNQNNQHHTQFVSSRHIVRPTFTISVQQPEAGGNVKQESSA